MLRLLFFLSIMLHCWTLPAQSFPAAWQGKWTGDLECCRKSQRSAYVAGDTAHR